MNSIKSILRELTERFRNAGFECPEVESALIIEEVTSIRRIEFPLHLRRTVSETERAKINSFAERRLKHEPFQYIFGWTQFRFIDINVRPGVLIPRPETEQIVDMVKDFVKPFGCVCELGTGSGAISLSLASERPDLRVFGSEISHDAFVIAESNRKKLELENVVFSEGDLFAPFAGRRFDAVAANLPYIARPELESLPENVRGYEPCEALFADDNGFALIEKTILQAPEYLNEKSILILEMGESHGEIARMTATQTGFFSSVSVEPDCYGVPRFLRAARDYS